MKLGSRAVVDVLALPHIPIFYRRKEELRGRSSPDPSLRSSAAASVRRSAVAVAAVLGAARDGRGGRRRGGGG